ncbi:Sad1-interacting factor 3 [Recurvomyces mirabilis]|nr:Sad1-interacting factor 3 [Recurvomyces mirabilis]
MSIAGPRGGPPPPKRNPAILVTDTREREQKPSTATAASSRPTPQRQGTRIISVDNVLQYASEIPSAQRRGPPGVRPANHTRTPSGRHPLEPKLRGVGVPLGGGLGAGVHAPVRSSKISERLVLLPETNEEGGTGEKDGFEEDEEGEDAPPDDEALARRRSGGAAGGKTDAERLPKSQRTAEAQLARVTAYCTAQSYRLRSTAQFVREQHAARTKIYEDCLYCVYQLPLLGGSEGFRVRSSPVVKNPGGRSVLDEQIEANERRNFREGWEGDSVEFSVRGDGGGREGFGGHGDGDDGHGSRPDMGERGDSGEVGLGEEEGDGRQEMDEGWRNGSTDAGEGHEGGNGGHSDHNDESSLATTLSLPSPQPSISPDAHTVAELFIFSYGVAVLWNFTPNQEKDLLADLTFSSTNSPTTTNPTSQQKESSSSSSNNNNNPSKSPRPSPATILPLMTRPLDEDDFETEAFHFQYSPHAPKPRIYNDMITLRTSDHMIKLAMSHAIGQSTKLSFFEERMQRTMSEAQYVPRRLALEGRLGMNRKEVVALVGRLFEGRVDVNLSSNMLDTPNFFWDSEPTLHPLYQAVREYLEIKPRIQVLNERCRVFLDLAEILSDSINDVKMTRITWIIIVLIVLSILVTCTEVFLRFAILAKGKGEKGVGGAAVFSPVAVVGGGRDL